MADPMELQMADHLDSSLDHQRAEPMESETADHLADHLAGRWDYHWAH